MVKVLSPIHKALKLENVFNKLTTEMKMFSDNIEVQNILGVPLQKIENNKKKKYVDSECS